MTRRLTYYIGATVDGFIAGPDGDTSFFPVEADVVEFIAAEFPETLPTHGRAALGIDPPNTRFDTVVMGRGTYAPALDAGITSPYAHLRQYVVSRSLQSSPDPAVSIVHGDPESLVRELKAGDGAGIYLAGGGSLAGQLLGEIDELVVKVYPVVAGAGIAMFRAPAHPIGLRLVASRPLPSGVVVQTYERPQ